MSEKVNIYSIVQAHFATFRNHAQNKFSLIDITVFVVCPVIASTIVFMSYIRLMPSLVSSLINASAILLGLLLNLLVLMFDQKNKAKDRINTVVNSKSDPEGQQGKLKLRIEVIDETVANISFTTLLCLASLLSLLAFSMRSEHSEIDLFERIIYSFNTFIWLSVSLIVMMILKRVFAIFIQNA